MIDSASARLGRWAVEQAVASFGAAGCDNEHNFTSRVESILYFVTNVSERPVKEKAK